MATNNDLVSHAKLALSEKWGYVWGTIGQVLTESVLSQKQKQYPSNINPYLDFIKKNYLGKRTADCVALIKSCVWWNNGNIKYTSDIDMTADTLYERAKEKGPISTLPEIPGLALWYKGHIGIYIGNGEVIEARGTLYGVVKTRVKERPWTNWCKVPFITYVEERPMKTWEQILDEVSANSSDWKRAINCIVAMANDSSNLGDLEIFKFLPSLIEKIYNR